MHKLTKLREDFVRLSERAEALKQAMSARQKQAEELVPILETAALTGDDATLRETRDALMALDAAFRADHQALDEIERELNTVREEIARFYARAATGKALVDWAVRTQKGTLHSDWGNRSYEGSVVFVNTELVEPELDALEAVFHGCIVRLEGDRLRVRCSVYRGTVWEDMDGNDIIKHLLPMLPKNLRDVSNFLTELAVLRREQ